MTVIALDLDRDRAQVHVARASTGLCAAHWVDLNALSGAPQEAKPCACALGTGQDNHAA